MVTRPRLLIAGTHSGVGKTTIAMGLTAALVRRGLRVQPFKVGPDYLDPTHLEHAAHRPAHNLDTWLLMPAMVRRVFLEASRLATLSIIEGVMGAFDGYGGTTERGSTAEVAKLLKVPVILVVDASHMARSVAAMVKGYREFDPALPLAGVVFNRVSERHAQLLRQSLRGSVDVPVLGYLPPEPAVAIPERHLGLVPAEEEAAVAGRMERLARLLDTTVDLERLVRIAHGAPALPDAPAPWSISPRQSPSVRLGIAKDRAFHFYYQDNLDLLTALGAELVPFSPLNDQRVPDGLHGLYLGGGFPEVFAEALSANRTCRASLARAIAAGLPTYAECGGLMYLAESLVDQDGRRHAMVGALPGMVRMTNRLQHFGYVTVIPKRKTILAHAADPIKGHEFHYSVWDYEAPSKRVAYVAVNKQEGRRHEGFAHGPLLASYIHVHFLTNPRWARGFVASAQRFRHHAPKEK